MNTIPSEVDARPGRRRSVFGPLVVAWDQRVLRPRPWTLAQSQWAREVAGDVPGGRMLELCCGVGHIGLAAAILSGRALLQIDAGDPACAFARLNALRAGWADRVEVCRRDLRRPGLGGERFPLIIADPPYVPSDRVATFPGDPVVAIDGGGDGLELVRRCLEVIGTHLAPDGFAIVQVADGGQARVAVALADELGFRPAGVRRIGDHGVLVGLSGAHG